MWFSLSARKDFSQVFDNGIKGYGRFLRFFYLPDSVPLLGIPVKKKWDAL